MYTHNPRTIKVQTAMTERCLEMLMLPPGQSSLLLDIGCGSGLSGEVLERAGHQWVGLDISKDMIGVAVERDLSGDMFLADMGQGFNFRPGVFDGAVSVSALQWLCYVDESGQWSGKRLFVFFTALYRALKRGARAAIQFYPESAEQIDLITTAALRCGFTGGVVVDFPNSTKARKHYLCLFAGKADTPGGAAPAAEGTEESKATGIFDSRRKQFSKHGDERKATYKSREWVVKKKETQRRRGVQVRPDSKYTARRRKGGF